MWGHESSLSHPTHSAEAASLMSASNAVHTFRYKSSGSGRLSPLPHCPASFLSSEVATFSAGDYENNSSHASHSTEAASSNPHLVLCIRSDTRAVGRGDPVPRCTAMHPSSLLKSLSSARGVMRAVPLTPRTVLKPPTSSMSTSNTGHMLRYKSSGSGRSSPSPHRPASPLLL